MTSGKATLPAILLLASLAAFAPLGAAEAAGPAPAGAAPASGACLEAARAPPCGYIVPQLALEFPDKPTCKSQTLGGPVDLAKCIPMPARGEAVQMKGTLRWYWDVTQDGTYPIDPQDPIVIQFGGTATNPKYMDLKVEPSSFTLDAAAMASPENLRPEPTVPQTKVWFWFERPITVTIERTADPTEQDLDRIAANGGVQKVFLKAKSNSSGAYFKEAFGVEEFRFNALGDPAIAEASGMGDGKESPGAPVLMAVAALGLGAVAARRRK